MTTWRDHLQQEKARWGDTTPAIGVSPNSAALDIQFNDGYGGIEGPDILIWTIDRVYFPVQYDGAEALGSAPRNPTGITNGQPHVGGG